MSTTTTGTSFSELLQSSSKHAHGAAQSSRFIGNLFAGTLNREQYAVLVAQHYFIYSALEGSASILSGDPVVATFLDDALLRVPSLEADLAFLLGGDWRSDVTPVEATSAYCDRIREVGATWPGGFVAHHYVRYLGDLSGGQMIAKVVKRACDLEEDGVRFYTFAGIPDPTSFKNAYRAHLDEAPWSDEERQRIIVEVLAAYDFNTRMLQEL